MLFLILILAGANSTHKTKAKYGLCVGGEK